MRDTRIAAGGGGREKARSTSQKVFESYTHLYPHVYCNLESLSTSSSPDYLSLASRPSSRRKPSMGMWWTVSVFEAGRRRQTVLDKRRRHVRRLILPDLLSLPHSLRGDSIAGVLSWNRASLPLFLLRRVPQALSGTRLARRANRGEVSDLRATRSAFLTNFCVSHPTRTRSIGRVCLQSELVASFYSVLHDGLSFGNRSPSQTSTHLHPRQQRFDK